MKSVLMLFITMLVSQLALAHVDSIQEAWTGVSVPTLMSEN